MKKKKTLLIVIIVLVILLILAGGAFAYIYFGTDLLKSDKQLFGKYMLMLGDEENGFVSTELNNYETRKETTAYTNSGRFSVNTQILGNIGNDTTIQALQQAIDSSNTTNITFYGSIDNPNKKAEENITINYSDSVNLPFTYKQEGDVYGIQADILAPNYIAVENNNLPDLLQKLGATDVTGIPNKIEPQVIESLQFTDEEKTHITNNYIMPIYESLSDDKFSKVENADGTTNYTLTLTNEEVRNIAVQLLQTLSNDTTMLTKINTILQEVNGEATVDTITSQDIQSLITELNNKAVSEGTVTLSVMTENEAVTGIEISFSYITITIEKEQTNTSLSYTIDIAISEVESEGIATPDAGNITLQLSYDNLNTNNVTETISFTNNVPSQFNMVYEYSNMITFGTTVNIESFGEDTIVLNNYPTEQVQSLIGQIGYIIVQTNTSQMSQIGYPTELYNPMAIWLAAPSILQIINPNNDMTDITDEASSMYANDVVHTDESVANLTAELDQKLKEHNIQIDN